MPMSLAEIPLGRSATIKSVEGPRAFRRRLLEMGLVPGVEVKVIAIAPFGDPLQIEIRGGQWSIRRAEAAQIEVEAATKSEAGAKSETTTTSGSGSSTARIAATADSR